MSHSNHLLHGVKIVDLSTCVSARLAARLLCDMGADVVRPDASLLMDETRRMYPSAEPTGTDEYRTLLDRGKRVVTRSAEDEGVGEWISRQLVNASLVVLDAGSPPVIELMTTSETLRPSTITVTAFGRFGPKATWRGGDLIAQASGGLLRISGESDRPPLPIPPDLTLGAVAIQVAVAGLGAIRERRTEGSPADLDVSEQEAVVGILEGAVTPYQFTGSVRERMGTMHPAVHGIGLQMTKDGRWVLFGTCPKPPMWVSLVETLGEPEWALKPEWGDARRRRVDHQEIDQLAAQTVAQLNLDEFYGELLEKGVPVGVVNDLNDVMTWDQILERGFMIASPTAESGDGAQPGVAFRVQGKDV